MTIHIARLIEELKDTKKLGNIVLAGSIDRMENRFEFCLKYDIPKIIRQEKQAKRVLYGLFDKETLKTIKAYDKELEKTAMKIIDNDYPWGYTYDYNMFTYRDNFQNMHDHEFRSFDTYKVVRTANGYKAHTTDPFNGYFESILDREEAFVSRHEEELDKLHKLLNARKELLDGNFGLKDEDTRPLAIDIMYYLGLLPKPVEDSYVYQKVK